MIYILYRAILIFKQVICLHEVQSTFRPGDEDCVTLCSKCGLLEDNEGRKYGVDNRFPQNTK